MNNFIIKARVSKIIKIYRKELNSHKIICHNKILLIQINMNHFLLLKTNRIIKKTWLIKQYFKLNKRKMTLKK